MDIEYLLWIQNFRESTNNALTPFFESLTIFVVGGLICIPIFIYWCVNKRNGLYIILSLALSQFINSIVKLTFCTYRPWIRDPRVQPVKSAISGAKGYSFPSGHVMDSAPIYGGFAVLCRKKAQIISWLCAVIILLTALSRNYLGVHTPQDVIVGILLTMFSLWLAAKILDYVDAHPEKENILLVIGFLLAVIVLIYVELKPYPMDYDSNGKLLVNPESMIAASLPSIGGLVGVVFARWFDRKYINFEHTGLKSFTGVLVAIIGLVIYFFVFVKYRNVIFAESSHVMRLLRGFLQFAYIIAGWPAVIKCFTPKK